jgi:RimJ/RimL family protein N-acetyltransferase
MDVRLRPVDDADVDAIFAMMRDPEAVALAAFTPDDPDDRASFEARLRRHRTSPDIALHAVDADGAFAGTVAAFTLDGEREVSYWIPRALWGHGIATAALALLLEVESTRPLHARVALHNAASRRVLERAGFAEVGRETSFAAGAGREVAEALLVLR